MKIQNKDLKDYLKMIWESTLSCMIISNIQSSHIILTMTNREEEQRETRTTSDPATYIATLKSRLETFQSMENELTANADDILMYGVTTND